MKKTPLCLLIICIYFFSTGSFGFGQTSCVNCHSDPEFFGEDRIQIVKDFTEDIHARVDLSCHDCHGGNPDPAVSDDFAAAMDPDFKANPYKGVVGRTEIPGFCGGCHSDPVFMKQYSPDIRIDQEEEYWTSLHGQALRKGDTKVAVCVDCHGIHGIRRVGDSTSPVFPKRVAETCAACHADEEHMSGYQLPDGRPLPTNQFAAWTNSVHGRAMLEKEDLSAPTCNDCHGNHGATPPGLESITFICGQCHSREAELFRSSSKHDGFQLHNELLAGAEGCTDCHEFNGDPPEIRSFTECASCHTNHAVMRPSLAMFTPLPETPCEICHEGNDEGLTGLFSRTNYQALKDAFFAEGKALGHSGDQLFDWMVDQIYVVPNHRVDSSATDQAVFRPEFARLFEKFRIGKTEVPIRDPSGDSYPHKVTRCGTCHDLKTDSDTPSDASEMARAFINRISELASLTARAERTLLRARRGGVEVREVLEDIDNAVNAQIELQVLVHTFSAHDEDAFSEKYREGLGYTRSALDEGAEALSELRYRRIGLGVSLIFIALVLVGLWLKIRQIG
jgi:predicted CXXCH cytochrome family protein